MLEIILWCVGYLVIAGLVHSILTNTARYLGPGEEMVLALVWPFYLVWCGIKLVVATVSVSTEYMYVAIVQWFKEMKNKKLNEKDSSQ